MDEATRRSLLFGKPLPETAEPSTRRLSGHSQGMVGGLEGLRQLQQAGVELPEGMQYEELAGEWAIAPTVDGKGRALSRLNLRALGLYVGILLLAAIPRLSVIFFVTGPQNPGLGWYGDTFHHWQIAYLSKEIGFSQGFLRLWDFKGMEYFWGLLHPLVLMGVFAITGSVDILIPRFVSLFAGSLSVVFIFMLARRYFDGKVAVAAALLAALNPVGVFSDASGMQEPLGIMLLLLGLLLWPRHPASTGIVWALAGMVRAEYWLFGLGLVVAAAIIEEAGDRKLGLAIGWSLPSLLYMKYLFDWTGNPIYPVYWNFMGNAAGEWMDDVPIHGGRLIAQWGFRIVAVLALIGLWRIFKNRPQHSLLYLLGFGNVVFLAILLGFSAYVRGFLPRFLVDRIFEWPYAFMGLLIAVLLMRGIAPKLGSSFGSAVSWLGVFGVLAASQIAWPVIWWYFQPGRAMYESEFNTAALIADRYSGGVISMPEDRPWQTYWLVKDFDLDAHSIEGQMYDPFAYISGDPFADWGENREAFLDWLESRDIQLLVFDVDRSRYMELVRHEPEWFHRLDATPGSGIYIYRVNTQ